MPSTVLERGRRWLDEESDNPGLLRFRSLFGAIWLVYDVADLLCGGTATAAWWPAGVEGAPHLLQALQIGLIVCELGMVRGAPAALAPLLAAALRGLEVYWFFRVNDFYYYIVIALLLSQVPAGAGWRRRPAVRVPAWLSAALRWQTAWIYLATGILKLNTAWLSGGHLRVRQRYLAEVAGWPYPRALVPWLLDLRVDSGLAWGAAMAEIVLGALVAAGRPRELIVAICVAIHTFGALGTNVWFFGASMVAQVTLLVPPRKLRR